MMQNFVAAPVPVIQIRVNEIYPLVLQVQIC